MISRLPVEFADSAKDDIYNITEYIALAAGSYRTAAKFVGRIEVKCQRIGDAPRAGRPRNDLLPGLRTVPFERSAVIAYVVEQDMIRIINVFYGGRDFETLLRGEESH